VPYRGGGPAMQDIIGGRVDYICTLTGSAVPLVEGKTVKAIAVLTKDRAPMLPEVKSSWEQGFKDLEASTWFGFMAPKGTPKEIVDKLHDATAAAMEDKEVQKQMLAAGAIIVAPERRSTEYFKAYIPKEIEKNAAPIRAAGLSME
jgi:tripartite-type tricarboxylate transporter receptor subunit TctC